MATRKRTSQAPARTNARAGGRAGKKGARTATAKGYASAAWERVYLLSRELNALAKDLGLHEHNRDPDGFDLADAARELARLAGNHNRSLNPDGRTTAQEKDDWIAAGGVGADLGNMADEATHASVAEGVRAVAYELCYLACNYLF